MSLGDSLRDAVLWHRKVADVIDQIAVINGGTASFSSNAYTVTTTPGITRLIDGEVFHFRAGGTNTSTTPTLAINSVSAVTIKDPTGAAAVAAGDIISGHVYFVEYDSSVPCFRLINPSGGWQTWSPTYSANGAMTFTTVTTTFARYRTIGKVLNFEIVASGTVGGTPNTRIQFTAPIAPANGGMAVTAYVDDGGQVGGFASWTGAVFAVRRYDSANWSAGAGRSIFVTGTCELS